MEVWHWTPLVALLAYAGLRRRFPDAYYQAAKIDGAGPWAVFRYIQLPKMRGVLTIAVLLRFMDSFMIYTEPFVLTGGGPGNSTTFLSIDLVKIALGQFDLGPAAAMSLIYFLITLLVSWMFYSRDDQARRAVRMGSCAACNPPFRRSTSCSCCCRSIGWSRCRSRRPTRSSAASPPCRRSSRSPTTGRSSTIRPGTSGYVNSLIYVSINTVISVAAALPAAYAFSRYRFVGDKHLFFWLFTNRMAPAAVFALPFLQLYSAVGLFDTHIARGPGALPVQHSARGLDPGGLHVRRAEGTRRDRLRRRLLLPALLLLIFMPNITAGIGVAAFFCFMFSWVEMLLSKTLTSVHAKPIAAVMTRTASTSGYELGLLAAAGC